MADKTRCLESKISKIPITITGLNHSGEIRKGTGFVQNIEEDQNFPFPEYPIRVTLLQD